MIKVLQGDCRDLLKTLPDNSVDCCVTSPPYFGLRDYGVQGQFGLEFYPSDYVKRLVGVFREVKRILKDDGTLWLNLGDNYVNKGKLRVDGEKEGGLTLTAKNMMGMPWRVAFAMQEDGWILRQDIIWSKTNPMPEKVTDRCTKSHEYIFLMSKSPDYYFDADSIRESWTGEAAKAVALGHKEVGQRGINPSVRRGLVKWQSTQFSKKGHSGYFNADGNCILNPKGKNKRDVWTISTQSCKGAHFSTFPSDLVRPCVLAGCPSGGVVLDPFAGSGTTGMVAAQEGRDAILIELSGEYIPLINERCGILQSETDNKSEKGQG